MTSLDDLKHRIFCIFYAVWLYIYTVPYIIIQLITTHRKTKISNQEGRIAMITGGGRGIGFETAKQLLNAGMIVVIVGMEKDQKEGVETLRKQYKDHVLFLECDLASLSSVRNMAKNFRALKLPLHILINNAGIMFAPRVETKDGFESQWMINYLSHFLLTHLLLGTLISSSSEEKPSRIVNLSSLLHYPGTINFDDIQGREYYSAEVAYTQSKLAMTIFANTLARRLQKNNVPVLVNSVHPAVAFTGLYQYVWWAKLIPGLGNVMLETPAIGSINVVYAAASDEVTSGGNYYEHCQVKTPNKEALSVEIGNKLWRVSCNQAGIKEFGKLQ